MKINFKQLTDSPSFTNALKLVIAAATPVILFSIFGNIQFGIAMALGAIFVFHSDFPGNLKHKINGLLANAFVVAIINLLINLTISNLYIFIPTLLIITFVVSMLAVYDQIAASIAFAGLLSVSLAFAHLNTGFDMVIYSSLILMGSLLYLFISLIFYFIKPYRYVELQVGECIKLTAKYLKLRGDLWELESDRKLITKKQLGLQVELNSIHENIREILIRNRTNYGSSNQNRRMLLSFLTLVEIMEMAVATSFDHNKLHEKFDQHPLVLLTYQSLAYRLSKTLKQVSKSIQNGKTYVSKNKLDVSLQRFEIAINSYKTELEKVSDTTEGVLMLRNMLDYAEKQVEKIQLIERSFVKKVELKDLNGREKEIEKLIQHHNYPLSRLLDNLSFKSNIFRHSLRISITILVGFVLGYILPFQNVYWIILTVVVIMKPGYGITKARTFNRFIGTVIGALIAFAILKLFPNQMLMCSLTTICMLLGFSFNPVNYRLGSAFLTIHIILIFALLTPDVDNVIKFRIIDTFVGALLAISANYFLWPTWEFLNSNTYVTNCILANKNYLSEIAVMYNDKTEVNNNYRQARSKSFIAVGNLMASFQRMLQEPKSKQNKVSIYYKLTALNNAFLSSAASLGTYTQSHKTTKASESFNVAIGLIVKKLEQSIDLIENKNVLVENKNVLVENTEKATINFSELRKNKLEELKKSEDNNSPDYQYKMQEIQMVVEQLIWLNNLSDNILKSTQMFVNTKNETED